MSAVKKLRNGVILNLYFDISNCRIYVLTSKIINCFIFVSAFHEVESSDKREKLDSLLGEMDKDNMEKTIIFVGVSFLLMFINYNQ